MEKIEKNNLLKSITSKSDTKKLSLVESIFVSLKSGINGALILFALLVFTKLLSCFAASDKVFYVSVNDLVISFWGFAIISFIVLAGLFKESK